MKKLIITLVAVSMAMAAHAQKSPKILTVDMQDVYNKYYKAIEANDKFKSSVENANLEAKAKNEEGQKMVEQLKELQGKLENPATAESAKASIKTQLDTLTKEIQQKQQELNQFRQKTDRTLQQRRQSIVQLHLTEIKEVVIEVAKGKGSDMVLNSNTAGVGAVVYFDESYDITADVVAKLNADKPSE